MAIGPHRRGGQLDRFGLRAAERLAELMPPALGIGVLLARNAERRGRVGVLPHERACHSIPEREDGSEVLVRGLGRVVQSMQARGDEDALEEAENWNRGTRSMAATPR
jgi:hypothetical protein